MAAEGMKRNSVDVGIAMIVEVLDSKNAAAVRNSRLMKVAMIITDAITQRILAELETTTNIYDAISLQSSSFESFKAGNVNVKNKDETNASIS